MVILDITQHKKRVKKKIDIGRLEIFDDVKDKFKLIIAMKEIRFQFDCKNLLVDSTIDVNLEMNSDRKELIKQIEKELENAKRLMDSKFKFNKFVLILKTCIKYPLTTLLMLLKIKRKK